MFRKKKEANNTLHSCHNFSAGSRQASKGARICETSLLEIVTKDEACTWPTRPGRHFMVEPSSRVALLTAHPRTLLRSHTMAAKHLHIITINQNSRNNKHMEKYIRPRIWIYWCWFKRLIIIVKSFELLNSWIWILKTHHANCFKSLIKDAKVLIHLRMLYISRERQAYVMNLLKTLMSQM